MGSSAIKRAKEGYPWVRRGFLIGLGCVAALYSLVLVVRALQQPEEMDQAAQNVLRALVAGDAATLMNYVSQEEREATGLDESSLKELIDRVFLPAFEGCKLVRTERYDPPAPIPHQYFLTGEFECKDGSTVAVSADVEAGDRPVCGSLTYGLVYDALTAYTRRAHPELEDLDSDVGLPKAYHVARYKAYRDLKPVFKSLRLKKVWLSATLTRRALSWDELEERLRRCAYDHQ